MDVPVQQDGVTTLAAADYNQTNTELETMIETSGQTKSAGDLVQVEKAVQQIAVSGQFYVDSGAANTVTLANPNNPILEAYRDGAAVRFIAANTNTGASTAVIDALPAKAIKTVDGNDVAAGDITAGLTYVITYNLSSDTFLIQNYYQDEDLGTVKEMCSASYTGASTVGQNPVLSNQKGITDIVSVLLGSDIAWRITFANTYAFPPHVTATLHSTNGTLANPNSTIFLGSITINQCDIFMSGAGAYNLNGFNIEVKGTLA